MEDSFFSRHVGGITIITAILTLICASIALFLAFYHIKVSDADKISTMKQFDVPADKAVDEYDATLKKINTNLTNIYLITMGSKNLKTYAQHEYIKTLTGVDKAVYALDDKSHVLKKYIYAPISVAVVSALVFSYATKTSMN